MESKKSSINLNSLNYLKVIIAACIMLSTSKLCAQKQNLFYDDKPLELTLKYNVKELEKDRVETSQYHDAILDHQQDSLTAKTYNVQIKARGHFRLKKNNCYFPPLRIKFNEDETKETIFSEIIKVKFVLSCQKNIRYEHYLLREYLAYKIYNILTEYSFKVRLIRLKIVDLDNKVPEATRYAFAIEPMKMLEKRNNGKELEVKNIHPNSTDYELMNLLSIFQYLIGNTDWSVKALHNIKLLSRDSLQKPVAIPYDFDFSGLVNAPYASPAEHLPIKTVKSRYYNGYSRPIALIEKNLLIFKEKKPEIYELVRSIDGLEKKHVDEILDYFDHFYKTIDNSKKIKRKFINNSRQ